LADLLSPRREAQERFAIPPTIQPFLELLFPTSFFLIGAGVATQCHPPQPFFQAFSTPFSLFPSLLNDLLNSF